MKPTASEPNDDEARTGRHATDRAEADRVLRAEAAAILAVADGLDDALGRAVDLIVGCAGALIVSGVGKSGMVGAKLSATFASTGTPSHFLHATEAMHGDLGRIRSNDAVMLLSYSGTGEEVLALAALVRQDGVPVIGMTTSDASPLAKLCDVHLCLGDLAEACPNNLAPTASTTAMLALGDALAMAVSARRNFTVEDFKKSHPGGMLGKKMMPVVELMRFRAGENLPLVSQSATWRESLAAAETGKRRAGALLVVDEGGRLAGIFTDGDVRRLLLAGRLNDDAPIADLMTRDPKRLADTALVRDAVQLVRESRLDEIPVVRGDGTPVGLIDVQDLIALRVVEDA